MTAQTYTVSILGAARRELRRIARDEQDRLRAAIRSLAVNPRPAGCVKLTGSDDLWRIRVGNYRVIYQIEDERLMILIVRVRHRREAYR
jgi:mRNA interferase RelE/StbE